MSDKSTKRRSITLVAAMVLAFLLFPVAAQADWVTNWLWEDIRNPGPYPDTCDMKGWTTLSTSGEWLVVVAQEESNCARLQIKTRYRKTNGAWTNYNSGWKYTSSLSSGYLSASSLDYSDHNGDNNGSGTAYGFRISFP